MGLSRRRMRWLCSWLMLPLLFMQLAAAAHACASGVAPAGEAVAAMPDCHASPLSAENADPAQLCQAHCAQGLQAVDAAHAGEWTPWPLLVSVIDWRHAAQHCQPVQRRLAAPLLGGAPPGSPPIYLSLLVLRN